MFGLFKSVAVSELMGKTDPAKSKPAAIKAALPPKRDVIKELGLQTEVDAIKAEIISSVTKLKATAIADTRRKECISQILKTIPKCLLQAVREKAVNVYIHPPRLSYHASLVGLSYGCFGNTATEMVAIWSIISDDICDLFESLGVETRINGAMICLPTEQLKKYFGLDALMTDKALLQKLVLLAE
jgi:hypothetical protein